VGADDMTIAFTLDADKAGSSGELFRLHGSFIVSVTKTGELQVSIMRDGAPTLSCATKGAGLNTTVNQDRDIVINLDDGQLQLWVDGKLGGQLAVPGVVEGATGFGSHGLVFGNPWGGANFNGDLSDFEITVGADAFPDKPQTVVMSSDVQAQEQEAASGSFLSSLDFPTSELRHFSSPGESRDALLDALHGVPAEAHDRFLALLQERLQEMAA